MILAKGSKEGWKKTSPDAFCLELARGVAETQPEARNPQNVF